MSPVGLLRGCLVELLCCWMLQDLNSDSDILCVTGIYGDCKKGNFSTKQHTGASSIKFCAAGMYFCCHLNAQIFPQSYTAFMLSWDISHEIDEKHCTSDTDHGTWSLNRLSKMPLSVMLIAWNPVPQNSPTPRHIRIVADRDAYGVRPRQSIHAANTMVNTTSFTNNI